MKKRIIGWFSLLLLILIFSSGMFARFMEFISWLLLLQYSGPETSLFGEIIVRVLTFLTTYSLVGLIFDTFDLYDKDWMKAAYFVISTLLGFLLAWVVWFFETYLLIIGIILGVASVGAIAYFVIKAIVKKKKEKAPKEQKQEQQETI